MSRGKFLNSMFFAATTEKENPSDFTTAMITRQNELGNSLLELLFKDVVVDTDTAVCNGCEKGLAEKDVNAVRQAGASEASTRRRGFDDDI
jgi:hypothetical protein